MLEDRPEEVRRAFADGYEAGVERGLQLAQNFVHDAARIGRDNALVQRKSLLPEDYDERGFEIPRPRLPEPEKKETRRELYRELRALGVKSVLADYNDLELRRALDVRRQMAGGDGSFVVVRHDDGRISVERLGSEPTITTRDDLMKKLLMRGVRGLFNTVPNTEEELSWLWRIVQPSSADRISVRRDLDGVLEVKESFGDVSARHLHDEVESHRHLSAAELAGASDDVMWGVTETHTDPTPGTPWAQALEEAHGRKERVLKSVADRLLSRGRSIAHHETDDGTWVATVDGQPLKSFVNKKDIELERERSLRPHTGPAINLGLKEPTEEDLERIRREVESMGMTPLPDPLIADLKEDSEAKLQQWLNEIFADVPTHVIQRALAKKLRDTDVPLGDFNQEAVRIAQELGIKAMGPDPLTHEPAAGWDPTTPPSSRPWPMSSKSVKDLSKSLQDRGFHVTSAGEGSRPSFSKGGFVGPAAGGEDAPKKVAEGTFHFVALTPRPWLESMEGFKETFVDDGPKLEAETYPWGEARFDGRPPLFGFDWKAMWSDQGRYFPEHIFDEPRVELSTEAQARHVEQLEESAAAFMEKGRYRLEEPKPDRSFIRRWFGNS